MTKPLGRLFDNRPIRLSLALVFGVLFVVPAALLAGLLAYQSSLQSRDQLIERLGDNAIAVARAIDAYIDRHEQGVALLVANLPADIRRDPTVRDRVLARSQDVFDGFLNTLVIDASGRIEAYALSERLAETAPPAESILRIDVSDRGYFTQVRESGLPYVSDVFQGRGIGDDWLVAMSAPLNAQDGAFSGVVVGFLDLALFESIWQRHQRLERADLTVLDQENRVVFSTRTPEREVDWASDMMAARSDGTSTLEWSLNENDGLAPHRLAVEELNDGWHAVVSVPTSRYRVVFWQELASMAWFVVLALAVLGLLALAIGRRITQPLERLAGYVRGFESDHAGWQEQNPIPEAPEELQAVVQGFNETARKLSESMRELRESHFQESALRRELEKVVKERELEIERRTRELQEQSVHLARAASAKSEFLANMSHEMRTPLTAIIGFVEAVLDEQHLNDTLRRRLATVLSNSRHLARLVGDVLDLSKIESGSLQLEMREVDLAPIIAEIHSSQTALATARGLSFGLEIVDSIPARLVTDSTRLRQILFNLTGNAIKFTHEGDVRLRLLQPSPGWLRLEVEDSGIGIDADTLGRLFSRFQQADSSVTRQYGGTGLGLTISRELAEALGGHLDVSSTPGKGSVFSLSVPVALDDERAGLIQHVDELMQHVDPADDSPAEPPLEGHVLLAEDNRHNQELIALLLERRGLSYEVVDNGRAALERARSGGIDLVLMDMHMPVMGGLEATRVLRESGFRAPVVALTADVLADHQHAQQAAGCDATLAKPIDRAALDKTLSQYLKPSAAASVPEETASGEPVNLALKRLRQKFVDKLRSYLAPIEEAIEKQDMTQLAEALHRLTGSAGSFGLDEISRRSARVEAVLREQGQVDADDDCLLALLEEVTRHQPDQPG